MRNSYKMMVGVVATIFLLYQSYSYAIDNNYVHLYINDFAVSKSELDNVLTSQLNFSVGINTDFSGKTVNAWILEGGKWEGLIGIARSGK